MKVMGGEFALWSLILVERVAEVLETGVDCSAEWNLECDVAPQSGVGSLSSQLLNDRAVSATDNLRSRM